MQLNLQLCLSSSHDLTLEETSFYLHLLSCNTDFMNIASHPLFVPLGLPNHSMAYWQTPQYLAITIQISLFFSSWKRGDSSREGELKHTMSTFRIYHCYQNMFTLRRPSDIHKSNGQELFADKYLIILVCAVHSFQKFTQFIHVPVSWAVF